MWSSTATPSQASPTALRRVSGVTGGCGQERPPSLPSGVGLTSSRCFSWEVGLPAPDVVFLLDIDPSAAAQRPGYGKVEDGRDRAGEAEVGMGNEDEREKRIH